MMYSKHLQSMIICRVRSSFYCISSMTMWWHYFSSYSSFFALLVLECLVMFYCQDDEMVVFVFFLSGMDVFHHALAVVI